MKKSLIIIAIAGLLYLLSYLFIKQLDGENKEFKSQLEFLHRSNDSLNNVLREQETVIIQMHEESEKLTGIIETKKERVKIIKVEVEKKREEVGNFDSLEVVKFLNERYPDEAAVPDTAIPINKPVLLVAAADLVSYDGAQEEIKIKDSIAGLQDQKIAVKDSIIVLMGNKEVTYKQIIGNKDIEISKWSNQYNLLQLENKKLKFQTKFARIASGVLLGGIAYTLLAK
jgi:hypothetical protein